MEIEDRASFYLKKLSRSIMEKRITKIVILLVFVSLNTLPAQTGNTTGSSLLIYSLIALAVLVFFFIVIQVSDNLLALEAKKIGVDGVRPSKAASGKSFFSPKAPAYAANKEIIFLKQGHDILLEGVAEQTIKSVDVSTFAVQPPNFRGISPIPKLTVAVGDEVKAGDELFFNKNTPDIKYVAPVSGEVVAINRGAKRAISEVVILADKKIKHRALKAFDLEKENRESLVNYLMDSGFWPLIVQRPYDIVADANTVPRDIFISTFDTAPLAPDANFIISDNKEAFQKGLDVLNLLTEGSVHLGLNAKSDKAPSDIFTDAVGVEKYWFHGKHPAGNAGVQIHHIKPINANDSVWVLGIQDVVTLGNIFLHQIFNAERIVAVTGAEVENPAYVKTYIGAKIGDLVKGNLKQENTRLVSGDVLSGTSKTKEGFLNAHDDQISVLEEGDYHEMFGWLLPLKPRPSISRSFPTNLFPNIKFKADTNTHGEKRAFVVTGQYEQVLPMDIYPQHLMKSIIVNDFERMEGLGIHELSEADIALCEFACTSKQPLQKILREGLDEMREQAG